MPEYGGTVRVYTGFLDDIKLSKIKSDLLDVASESYKRWRLSRRGRTITKPPEYTIKRGYDLTLDIRLWPYTYVSWYVNMEEKRQKRGRRELCQTQM